MSQKEKLIARLKSIPKDFTFDEAEALLNHLCYQKSNKGKTSGSRVSFIHNETGAKISLHRPHPQNVLPEYAIKQLLEHLKQEGLI